MRFVPMMVLALALASSWVIAPVADAKGGGGHGGGAGMGGDGRGSGMSANTNAGGQAIGSFATGGQSTAATNTSLSKSSNGRIAAALGALNASHASASALSHASSNSRVGRIAAYRTAMLVALAMPKATPTEIAARNAAIANARATLLAKAANKPLTARVVAVVDRRLGLPHSNPSLGL